MFSLSFIIPLLLVGSSEAKRCTNFTIPLNVNARQGIYALSEPSTTGDVAFKIQNSTTNRGGGNFTERALTGYQNVTGWYNIIATYCTPDMMPNESVVQVLTHGLGFDKSYWNYPYNNFSYSYVEVAVDNHSYCTLFYDRLGIADSSQPNPISVVRAPIEVNVLYQVNSMLRQGTLPSVAHAFNTSGSIVNVGHSFGSQLTYALSSQYPNVTDAVVLTGFSTNGSFANGLTASTNSEIAFLNQPLRFGSGSVFAQNHNRTLSSLTSILASSPFNLTPSQQADLLRSTTLWDLISGLPSTPSFPFSPQNLSSGYLTWASSFGNQYNFLYPPGIDPMILPYSESTKQPYTMGKLLTTGNISPASPIAAFTGPVLIVDGVEDSFFCGGDCLSSITGQPNGTTVLDEARKNLPRARTFRSIALNETGHAINLHYSARGAYEQIQQFLKGEGIVPR